MRHFHPHDSSGPRHERGHRHGGGHEREGLRARLEMLLIGRHRGGFFGGDDEFVMPGREGRGRHGGGPRGRMFGQGDLKLLLLALLEQQPRHGYELIRAIEELCKGLYTPSPGAIYPTLSFLEEAGYIEPSLREDGAKKSYTITAEGRAHLDAHRTEVQVVMQRLQLSSRMMAKLSVPDAVRESVHRLKHVLMAHDRHWSEAEMQRVIAIVDRAATEIAAASDEVRQ